MHVLHFGVVYNTSPNKKTGHNRQGTRYAARVLPCAFKNSARKEVGVTSRSCGNLQHFSFWTRKMRWVPRLPSRECILYCKIHAKELFWTCLKLTAKSRFVLKLPTRAAHARSFYVFRAGSQVRPETPPE